MLQSLDTIDLGSFGVISDVVVSFSHKEHLVLADIIFSGYYLSCLDSFELETVNCLINILIRQSLEDFAGFQGLESFVSEDDQWQASSQGIFDIFDS